MKGETEGEGHHTCDSLPGTRQLEEMTKHMNTKHRVSVIHLSVSLCGCLSVTWSVNLSITLSVCYFVCQPSSADRSAFDSLCDRLCMSFFMFVFVSIYLLVCHVCLSFQGCPLLIVLWGPKTPGSTDLTYPRTFRLAF